MPDLLIFDPLKLPFNHHLSQVHSQLPLLNSDTGGEAESLHGADHVLHEVMPYRVVNLTTNKHSAMSKSFWLAKLYTYLWPTIRGVKVEADSYPEVLHNEVQYMDQLWHGMPLLYNDLAGPVSEHLMPILHAGRYSWGKDSHGLPHDGTSLHSVSFQQTVKHLKKKHSWVFRSDKQ